jgi:soluble lytic murein transglycosylase-like protein
VGAVKGLVLAAALAMAAPAFAEPVDRWTASIEEASARFGLPADWIRRVMRIESGGHAALSGRPVVSTAGAMGLMQLMPATWSEMRSLLGLGTDPHNPRDNILAGTAYLRAMYDRFGYPGLFAAYNAGPGRYAAHLATGAALPAQTRAYLIRAVSTRPQPAFIAANPELFVAGPGAGSAAGPDAARRPGAIADIFVQLTTSGRP